MTTDLYYEILVKPKGSKTRYVLGRFAWFIDAEHSFNYRVRLLSYTNVKYKLILRRIHDKVVLRTSTHKKRGL